jgi:crossover junction endodeoxyribonuclease RusA
MPEYRIALPWPPSVNTYWRYGKGRFYISKKGIAYRDQVILNCMQAKLFKKMLLGTLSVSIWAYPPDKRHRDIDNLLKAVLDALEHAGVYKNDNQIATLVISRRGKVKGGSLQVTIHAIN